MRKHLQAPIRRHLQAPIRLLAPIHLHLLAPIHLQAPIRLLPMLHHQLLACILQGLTTLLQQRTQLRTPHSSSRWWPSSRCPFLEVGSMASATAAESLEVSKPATLHTPHSVRHTIKISVHCFGGVDGVRLSLGTARPMPLCSLAHCSSWGAGGKGRKCGPPQGVALGTDRAEQEHAWTTIPRFLVSVHTGCGGCCMTFFCPCITVSFGARNSQLTSLSSSSFLLVKTRRLVPHHSVAMSLHL